LPLELTGTGYGPYWRPTVRRVELFSDWLEAQVLRLGTRLAKAEVVEVLEGTGFVKDSDDAWALIPDAFAVLLGRRGALQDAYPF